MHHAHSELSESRKQELIQCYGRVLEWMELIPGTTTPFVWGTLEPFDVNYKPVPLPVVGTVKAKPVFAGKMEPMPYKEHQ